MVFFVFFQIDGYSNYILSWSVMDVKNNVTILKENILPVIRDHNNYMPNQLSMDGGMEFRLTEYALQLYSHTHRVDYSRTAVVRGTSRQNHPIERLWRDVNEKITFKLKWAFRDMESQRLIDMSVAKDKFVVGHLFRTMVKYGLGIFVPSFNSRNVGGGSRIPELLRLHNTIPATPLTPLPSAEDFADIFVADGHSLTRPRVPVHLDVGPELLQLLFDVHSDNCREAYSHAVNNNYTEFSAIIMDVIASVGL